MLVQYFVPVNFLNLHTCLVVGNILGHGSNVVEGCHVVNINFHTKGVLDESLQTNLVERIHCKIGLDMVSTVYGNLLFLLDVVLQYLVFIAGRLGYCLHLGGMILATTSQYILQLISLQFVQLGAWQVVPVNHYGHELLVARCV